jgi:hypothetical protein
MSLALKNRPHRVFSAAKSQLLALLISAVLVGVAAQAFFAKPVSVSAAAAPKLAPLVADRGKFRIMVKPSAKKNSKSVPAVMTGPRTLIPKFKLRKA